MLEVMNKLLTNKVFLTIGVIGFVLLPVIFTIIGCRHNVNEGWILAMMLLLMLICIVGFVLLICILI